MNEVQMRWGISALRGGLAQAAGSANVEEWPLDLRIAGLMADVAEWALDAGWVYDQARGEWVAPEEDEG